MHPRGAAPAAALSLVWVLLAPSGAGAQMMAPIQIEGAPPAGSVPLRVEGVEGTAVELRAGADNAAVVRLRCAIPCATGVLPGSYFMRVPDGDEALFEPIEVGASGARVRLRHPSGARYVGGIVLATFGAASAAFGLSFGIGAFTALPGDPYNNFVGAMMLVMGVGLLGVPPLAGGIVLARNARAGVAAVEPAPAAAPTSSERRDAFQLVPVFGPGGGGIAGRF